MTNQNITKPEEIWKPIDGYEGYYEVSDHGRVRSLDRFVFHKDAGQMLLRGQAIQPATDRGGYLTVGVCMHGKSRTIKIHRLVLTAFDRPPKHKEVAMHLDNNPKNNHASNLKWGTRLDNVRQCIDEGRAVNLKGHAHGRAKLTSEQVKEIRMLHAKGDITKAKLARRFGMSESAIRFIINRKNWKHV